jgi:hypothetical protein
VSRPLQLALLEGDERRVGGFVPSVISGTNADLLAAVAPLYLTGSVLDTTYGRGMWWRRFTPAPFAFHDLALDGVDFRALPHEARAFDAVCFDPPYVPRQGPNTATQQKERDYRDRFGLTESRSESELDALVRCGLAECARVADRWVLVKCSDYTNCRRLRLGHELVLGWGRELGLRVHDLIVHASGPGPGGGRVETPVRARRYHSYLLVFARPAAPRSAAVGPESVVNCEPGSPPPGPR